ncbi:MAG: phosphatase PAP2 family protein, partial [Aquabacterium sp.]
MSTPLLSAEQWRFITRLGESQILLPAMAAVLLWLWFAAGSRTLAWRWWLGTALAVLAVTASKVAFFGYEVGYAPLNYTGPSGHAMFACAVLPVLALLCTSGRSHAAGAWALAVGAACAALVAWSRVPVGAHSASEVVAGATAGYAAALFALHRARSRGHLPRQRIPLWMPLAVAAWLALTPSHAPPSPTHGWVVELSLAVSGRDQPYSRREMRARYKLQLRQEAAALAAAQRAAASAAVEPGPAGRACGPAR